MVVVAVVGEADIMILADEGGGGGGGGTGGCGGGGGGGGNIIEFVFEVLVEPFLLVCLNKFKCFLSDEVVVNRGDCDISGNRNGSRC